MLILAKKKKKIFNFSNTNKLILVHLLSNENVVNKIKLKFKTLPDTRVFTLPNTKDFNWSNHFFGLRKTIKKLVLDVLQKDLFKKGKKINLY